MVAYLASHVHVWPMVHVRRRSVLRCDRGRGPTHIVNVPRSAVRRASTAEVRHLADWTPFERVVGNLVVRKLRGDGRVRGGGAATDPERRVAVAEGWWLPQVVVVVAWWVTWWCVGERLVEVGREETWGVVKHRHRLLALLPLRATVLKPNLKKGMDSMIILS